MYPFIDILGTQIHMTWIGILVFLFVFLIRTRRYIKQFDENRSSFWVKVPLYILVIYFVSSYAWFLIEEFIVFPMSLRQFMAYISPFEYKFHLVGIIWAIGWCVRDFFKWIQDTNVQLKRIDAWFLAAMWACVPLGIFLLLGDTFIGQPTDWSIFVSSFHPDSKLATYNKVIPLALAISLVSLVFLLITKILRLKKPQIRWYWLIGWILFLIAVCIIILFQEYTRHLVVKFLWKTRDLNNYVLLVSAGFLIRKYKTKYAFFSNLK